MSKFKNNVQGKLKKEKCNISDNRIRYLLNKFNVKSLLEVKTKILKDLKERLKVGITDVRQSYKTHYKIWDILVCVIIANFSDVYDWEDIEVFVKVNCKWFKSFLQMTGGIPNYQTYERVFSLIDHKELENILIAFYKDLIYVTRQRDLLSIDGRTSNGSSRKITEYNSEKLKPLNVLSAYSNQYGICLASEMIDDKTNEIPTIPDILDRVVIKDCIVTWDALNTQTINVEKVIDKKLDYVVPIKANHPTFYQELKEYFHEKTMDQIKAGRSKSAYAKSTEKSHSTFITYEYFQTEDIKWYADIDKWKGVKSIGVCKKTIEKNGEITVEYRYYIASIFLNITEFANAIRNHWFVENKLHWHLDFTFREDKNTTKNKNALMNLQIVNKFTLAILNKVKSFYDNKSLKRIRKIISFDFENSFETLLLYIACA